ncbi:MAG: hypothetical protein M3O36_16745 [Myxococcota bacterium]|nr:hypothetical protein [Myxococcota bacterium]
MELSADAVIPFPREAVFAAYRDDLAKLLPYLPNVRSIEVKSRTETGPVVEMVNVWHGGGDIPAAARAILSESMLSWTDHATWNREALRCDWRIETHALSEAVRCFGHDLFLEPRPGETLLQIRGTIEIDGKKIRGVPGFLAGKVSRTVEEVLLGKIQPNLVETAKGLTKYLQQRAG